MFVGARTYVFLALALLLCLLKVRAELGQKSVVFVNEHDESIDINWKGPDSINKITEVPAMASRKLFTFNGHVFFATLTSDDKKRVGPKKLIITEDKERYVVHKEVPEDVCMADDESCGDKADDDDDDDAEDDIDIMMRSTKDAKIINEAKELGVKIAKGSNAAGAAPKVDLNSCSDRHDACPNYFKSGECTRNPGWMIVNCPKSCDACELRDPKIRCDRGRLNISTSPIYAPGEMHSMFSSIPEKWAQYGVEILSTEPYVVTFDNFLTDEESDALIETNKGNWERSTDTGQVNAFGETGRVLSVGRTSSNAWCRHNCLSNPHVQNVMKKIEEVTLVPRSNFESFQVLQYESGQKYNVHHDMSPRQVLLSCGPRVLTFFLYLSDVEEGGETGFPRLGIDVKPKKGKALLWPSTMDKNPEQMDPRTHHEAKPVVKGKKYAANTWIHLYDFEKSNLWGCTGTFD